MCVLTPSLEQENSFLGAWAASISVKHAARPAAWEKLARSTSHRLLFTHQSSDAITAPNILAVRNEFSLLGFTPGGLLLPYAGRKGSLKRPTIASCSPYGCGIISWHITGFTVETPEGYSLCSRQQSRINVQPGSAPQGLDSALHQYLAAHGWCGVRVPSWMKKILYAARQLCARKDWQKGQDDWNYSSMKSNLKKVEQKLDLLWNNVLGFSY